MKLLCIVMLFIASLASIRSDDSPNGCTKTKTSTVRSVIYSASMIYSSDLITVTEPNDPYTTTVYKKTKTVTKKKPETVVTTVTTLTVVETTKKATVYVTETVTESGATAISVSTKTITTASAIASANLETQNSAHQLKLWTALQVVSSLILASSFIFFI